MELKTKIVALDGRQDLTITREFDLPVELLFKAYIEPEMVQQWMGTKVIKLENNNHGGYQFITTDPLGYKHIFSGVIHEITTNKKITRTFEMENTNFPVQLEFLDFTSITDKRSKLEMHVVYKSIDIRDQILKLPFAKGINMAHDRIQEILNDLK